MRCLHCSRMVHSCNDLNPARGQCLQRSSALRALDLFYPNCQVLKYKKNLLGWGFQMSLGLEENPLWASTESTDPPRLVQNLAVRNFTEEE